MQDRTWRLVGPHYELVLVAWGGGKRPRGAALTPAEALRALDAILAAKSPRGVDARTFADAVRALRRSSALLAGVGSDRALVREALYAGRLRVWREELRLVPAPVDDLDAAAALVATSPTRQAPRTWIEIVLLDMEDAPVPGERYWIRCPDGRVITGALDERGRAYVGNLDPGQCDVCFPDLDSQATSSVAVVTRDAAPIPEEDIDEEAQAVALLDAAELGLPFCEECERARQALLQAAQAGEGAWLSSAS